MGRCDYRFDTVNGCCDCVDADPARNHPDARCRVDSPDSVASSCSVFSGQSGPSGVVAHLHRDGSTSYRWYSACRFSSLVWMVSRSSCQYRGLRVARPASESAFGCHTEGHNGGVWKMANTIDDLRSKATRLGTYDMDLKTRIGD
ncbi:toxin C-terminal domain-containing protein [uncultured Leifsonia sp.]|uniref:toxin C-terminal domain-containing protein n=1 Tax=uncultured Leifsonia sp. TaxID=340359 RepID=UPI0037DD5E04